MYLYLSKLFDVNQLLSRGKLGVLCFQNNLFEQSICYHKTRSIDDS